MFLITWLTPERFWWWLSAKAAGPVSRIATKNPELIAETVKRVAGKRRLARPPESVAGRIAQCQMVRILQVAATVLPGPWRPKITIEGEANLKDALAQDKGAIVWDNNFIFGSLVTKMAMHRLGHGMHHLSLPQHGFNVTWFAIFVLNPLWIRSERRFLAERVVMLYENPTPAIRKLLARLKEKRVVSFTVRPHAQYPVTVRLLDGRYVIAPGALDLAYRSGAPVLPVSTVKEDDGAYKVVIGKPISVDRSKSREKAVADAVKDFAKMLEPHILSHPGQWVDWYSIKTADDA